MPFVKQSLQDVSIQCMTASCMALTLNIGNTLVEDLLKNLGVLKLLLDLGNNRLSELTLLPLLDLSLVAYP